MVYDYVSSEVVIASFLSRTRLTDLTYADDLLEWLKEGVDFFRLRNNLVPTYKVVEIKNNIGSLPCGMVFLDGIMYNGCRLRLGTGATDVRIQSFRNLQTSINTYFATDINTSGWTVNEQSYLLLRGDDIKSAKFSDPSDYYIPYPKHIQTSFCDGCVQVFFRKMPTDDNGYPLIPNESNCRMSIFWWLMAAISLTGYKHNDPRHDYTFCIAEHHRYYDEGIRLIKSMSTDKKEALKNLMVNLIPPVGYYERFGVGGERPNGYE